LKDYPAMTVRPDTSFDYTDAMLEAAVDKAVAAERERCAKIAEKAFNIGTGHPFDEGVREGCRRAARAIRSQKD